MGEILVCRAFHLWVQGTWDCSAWMLCFLKSSAKSGAPFCDYIEQIAQFSLDWRSLMCHSFKTGRFSLSISTSFTPSFSAPSKPNSQEPMHQCPDSLKQDGRKRQKFSLILVDMWLCLALWILLSVWISSCVFFTEMTVFLFRWQPLQDQIDSSLKAADEKQH